jgi:hypothetical protein
LLYNKKIVTENSPIPNKNIFTTYHQVGPYMFGAWAAHGMTVLKVPFSHFFAVKHDVLYITIPDPICRKNMGTLV